MDIRHQTSDLRRLRRCHIGIVGLGTMGSAMVRGLLAAGVERSRVLGAERRADQRRRVSRALRIRVLDDVATVVRRSDIILLAVKPQELAPVLADIRSTHTRPLVISIAAGITTRFIAARAGRMPVVRAMPNTAARIGRAVTAVARGRFALLRHAALAHALFSTVGDTVDVPERLMDAVTAVSGSGPAYFFWLTEELARAGAVAGLPRATAERLARQTAIGSAGLLAASDASPEALIAQVASKRGTTEAALRVFARRRMGATLRHGVRAAARRAAQLSQEASA